MGYIPEEVYDEMIGLVEEWLQEIDKNDITVRENDDGSITYTIEAKFSHDEYPLHDAEAEAERRYFDMYDPAYQADLRGDFYDPYDPDYYYVD